MVPPERFLPRKTGVLSAGVTEYQLLTSLPADGHCASLYRCVKISSSSLDWRTSISGQTDPDRPDKPCVDSGMPVKKKRKSSGSDDPGLRKCKTAKTSAPGRLISPGDQFSSKKCLSWFYEYAGSDEVVGPEGMEKFCEDIGVEPENIVMLVLAWKLEALNMGFFTKEEWINGMTLLQCDCNERLQGKLDYLRSQLNDTAVFKNIYRYAFDFARDKDQRSLDMDTAKSMLALLLGRTWPLFPVFHQFLEQSRYKVMNKDQWYNVLEFSRTVQADLSNYDEDGAWPVLLDEFVEWQKVRPAL